MARPVILALIVALIPGCKAMGTFGHVASGVGHVASGVGHVAGATASGVAKVAPVLDAVAHVLPIALDVASLAMSTEHEDDYAPGIPDVIEPPTEPADPCARCADDVACGTCAGYDGVACELTPPGPWPRCASPAR
jgi:hypothetical protein